MSSLLELSQLVNDGAQSFSPDSWNLGFLAVLGTTSFQGLILTSDTVVLRRDKLQTDVLPLRLTDPQSL